LILPLLIFWQSPWLQWLLKLGAVGLVALGILDASVVPLPGSLDLLCVILSAHKHEFWPLYAAAAWVGSVGGGYLTYRLGVKGGKEQLEKKIPKKRLERVYKWMEEHSSLTLFIPTLMPPPTPVSYFILAAGAMGISKRKYFLSFGSAKAIRFILIAYFSSRYGHQIIGWTRHNYKYMLAALLSLLALALIALGGWAIYRRRRGEPIMPHSKEPRGQEAKAA
jgi:membrane protein DedA with SNARE-associated domain